MIRRNRAKSSSLFLLELILAILFFSIASAVCVQFFVKSHLLSRDARELNVAVTEVSNAAELVDAADDIPSVFELVQSEYPDSKAEGTSHLSIYFDQDLQSCTEHHAVYVLSIDLSEKEYMIIGTLNMTRLENSEQIYSLDISHHLKRRYDNGI